MIVTTPERRSTTIVSWAEAGVDFDDGWESDDAFTPATIMTGMGFDPYRKFVARKADYIFVAAAIGAAVALVAWAVFG